MLILLPPSESKATRPRGAAMQPERLSAPELTAARATVADALARASARPAAPEVLGVSPNLGDEIARNLELTTAPSLPARDLYTGVLYDALDLPSLDAAARRRANRRIIVISALFGALRLTDRVPPYRLSMAVNLPSVGPLAGHWRQPLALELPEQVGRGLVIDCRSSTYAAAWVPHGALTRRWVQIRVPGATHMAKHTRGLVTRALCQSSADPRSPRALTEVLAETFRVDLHEPGSSTRPWVLDVHPPT